MNGSFHPCFADSARILVYGQFGGLHWDIFYAFRNDTGGYGQAIRCDSTINTATWDSSPSCPEDASLLYFDSWRGEPSVPRLYVAHWIDTANTPKPRQSILKHSKIQIYPSFGSTYTHFRINVPTQFKGEPVHVMNILGQAVDTIVPTGSLSTYYHWRGTNHAQQDLSNGVYFLVVTNQNEMAVGKMLIVK
jgi:hypothetical protein